MEIEPQHEPDTIDTLVEQISIADVLRMVRKFRRQDNPRDSDYMDTTDRDQPLIGPNIH